jgi:hypothetical protein
MKYPNRGTQLRKVVGRQHKRVGCWTHQAACRLLLLERFGIGLDLMVNVISVDRTWSYEDIISFTAWP